MISTKTLVEALASSSTTLTVSFLMGGGIGAIQAVDLATGALTVNTTAAGFNPTDLAFGPNGNLLVTNAGNNTIQEFDGTTGALVNSVNVSGTPTSIAFNTIPSQSMIGAAAVSGEMEQSPSPDTLGWDENNWSSDLVNPANTWASGSASQGVPMAI